MLLPSLLRDARRRRGLSVRAAAEAAGVPRTTWARWEAGDGAPTATRLDEVLRALGYDLRLTDRALEPRGESAARRHLSRSLTERVQGALAEQYDAAVTACREHARLLTGPAAVGLWVPGVVARGPLPLPRARRVGGTVSVHLTAAGGAAVAHAPTPAMLITAGAAALWPGLITAERLLAEESSRDAGGRRTPAHRDPDEEREVSDLAHTLTWGATVRTPVSPSDSRAWRLGAPASLDQQLVARGFPKRHEPRMRGSRP